MASRSNGVAVAVAVVVVVVVVVVQENVQVGDPGKDGRRIGRMDPEVD